MLEIFGYFGAIVVGLVMGLLGGGGSILTIPILVYTLGVSPVLATAYSLFVVGTTSVVGTITNFKNKLIDVKIAITFAIPSFIAVYLTRRYLLPSIPDSLYVFENFTLTKDIAIMIFFAIIMFFSSISMIRGRKSSKNEDYNPKQLNYPLVITEGAVVGVLTGIVGAGGGFLIVPALVLLANLPMKRAVATSLFIIAIKSLIGFLGDIQVLEMDWIFILTFTFLSIIGIFIGQYLNKYIKGPTLKKGFGWFVLIMAIFIIMKEVFLN